MMPTRIRSATNQIRSEAVPGVDNYPSIFPYELMLIWPISVVCGRSYGFEYDEVVKQPHPFRM